MRRHRLFLPHAWTVLVGDREMGRRSEPPAVTSAQKKALESSRRQSCQTTETRLKNYLKNIQCMYISSVREPLVMPLLPMASCTYAAIIKSSLCPSLRGGPAQNLWSDFCRVESPRLSGKQRTCSIINYSGSNHLRRMREDRAPYTHVCV